MNGYTKYSISIQQNAICNESNELLICAITADENVIQIHRDKSQLQLQQTG